MPMNPKPQPNAQSPMVIALGGLLMINLTVLCVIIGFRDAQTNKPSVVAPIQTSPVIAQARTMPDAPALATSVSPAQVPGASSRPAAPAPQLTEPPQASFPTPAPITQAHVDPQSDRPSQDSEPAEDDQPLTFFGMPVE